MDHEGDHMEDRGGDFKIGCRRNIYSKVLISNCQMSGHR
jgi:hypothetical protein